MTWAKVDDHANEHRKQLAAGAEACWLWTCGLMYANRQAARDGFIPDGMLGMLYPFKAPTKLALRLVEVGLWERVSGGYLIHQFTFWNQTKEQREAELSSGRERAAKSYSLRAKNRKSSGEETAKTPGEEIAVLHNSSGSTPTPLPLHSHSLPQQISDAPTREEAAVVAAPVRGLVPARKPAPTNHADALAIPIPERARLVLEDPGNGAWSEPQRWPEVVAVAESLAKAAGNAVRPRLGGPSGDSGTKRVLQLLADGWPPAELVALASAVGRSKWWREGGVKGLSSLTPEVLRRAQNENARRGEPQVDPETAREIAKTRALVAGIGSGGA